MRRLTMLEDLRVASPCSANWNEMVGDDRVRFCSSCEKSVFNLSAMLTHEAEQLLAERTGGEMCVRFYQRTDGTVMTQDCPVGVKKKRRKKLALAVAGAGALAAAAATAFFHHREETCSQIVPTGSGAALPSDDTVIADAPPIMGSAPPPVLPPPAIQGGLQPVAQPPMLMGRRASSTGHTAPKKKNP